MIISAIATLITAYVLWTFVCLENNVRKARAMGVPIVRIPIDPFNVPWLTFQPLVWSILDRLPIPWSWYPDWLRFSRRGWHFADKSDTHVRLGAIWALVTPVAIILHVADADAVNDMFLRREDFVRPIQEYKLLEVYGPCLSTAGWDDWARHRKPLAAPFNENMMQFVWKETLNQAEQMLKTWRNPSALNGGIPSVQRDMRTLSLNVLASVGFNESYSFHGSSDGTIAGDSLSYRDALQTVLDGVILLMVVPIRLLTLPFAPTSWRRLGQASKAFQKHMEEMVERETSAASQGRPSSSSIMGAFVQALGEHNRNQKTDRANAINSRAGKRGLSLQEIYGNLFVINFAGHDTTANTLAFATFLIASHPDVQVWLSEEINSVTKDLPVEEWDYKTLFPKLERCRAVLLETLRLYPPVMLLPKRTPATAQTLTIDGKTVIIPPHTSISPYMLAIQSHPKYWDDAKVWKPSRWIVQQPTEPSSAPGDNTDGPLSDKIITPSKGTFLPWSDGPQYCPGRKFAEVEAVAVFAYLFKSHFLRPKVMAGESEAAARQRVMDCTFDIDQQLLLRMRDRDMARLVCEDVSVDTNL